MQASDVMVCCKHCYYSCAIFASYAECGFISVPSPCTTGNVRLVDGGSEREGRVEVCRGGVWGAVAEYKWDFNDAKVTCRQLGYPSDCELASMCTHS